MRNGKPDIYYYLTSKYNELIKQRVKESIKFTDQADVKKVDNLIDVITTRDSVKSIVMRYVYSEGPISRSHNILSIENVKEIYDKLSDNADFLKVEGKMCSKFQII